MAQDGTKADTPKSDGPKSDTPKSDAPALDASKADTSKASQPPHKADQATPDAKAREAGTVREDRKAVEPSPAGRLDRAPEAKTPVTKLDKAEPTRPGRPGSEWTASDDRGPLSRAEEEAEAEAQAQGRSSGAPHEAHDTTHTNKPASTHAPDIAALIASTPGEPVPPVDAIAAASAPGASGLSDSSSTAGRTTTTLPAAEPRKTSLWPVAAALIIGALIGAGSAAFVYRGYADDSQPDPRLASLQARLDALEKRPDPQPAINGLKSSVTALDNQMAGLRRGAGKTEASTVPEQPSAPAAPAAAPAQVDLGPVNDKIAALQSRIDALKSAGGDTKALEAKITALEGALAGMKTATDSATAGVSSVEGKQKEIVGQQKALAGKVMMPALAVVADSLVQQIDRGQPYAAQVDALTALGADPAKVATLRANAANGVPSANVLAAKFEPLALPITTTAHKAPPNAGLVDRLKSGMFSIVSVRRADDTSGDDLASRVARIRAALAHDDVAGALDAWNALPADAKAKADAWAALAKTHVDAMTAARALQRDAIAALATSKS